MIVKAEALPTSAYPIPVHVTHDVPSSADVRPTRAASADDQPQFYRTDLLSVTNYSDNAAWSKREGIYRLLPVQPQGELVRRIDLRGDETVLDVGVANGRVPLYMRAHGHHGTIVGIDINRAMLKEPIKHREELHSEVELAVARLPTLPYKDKSFDVVVASNMLYHVADIPQTLAEFYRVLKDDGKLVVATFGSSMQHLPKMNNLKAALAEILGVPDVPRLIDRFSAANAEAIIEAPLPGVPHDRLAVVNEDRYLDVPAVSNDRNAIAAIQPFVDYIDSLAQLYFPDVSRDRWEKTALPIACQYFLEEYLRNGRRMEDQFHQGIFVAQKKSFVDPEGS